MEYIFLIFVTFVIYFTSIDSIRTFMFCYLFDEFEFHCFFISSKMNEALLKISLI